MGKDEGLSEKGVSYVRRGKGGGLIVEKSQWWENKVIIGITVHYST